MNTSSRLKTVQTTQILQWVQLNGCNISTLSYTHTPEVQRLWCMFELAAFLILGCHPKMARLVGFWNWNLKVNILKCSGQDQDGGPKKWKTYWGCGYWVIVMVMILNLFPVLVLVLALVILLLAGVAVGTAAGGSSGGGGGGGCVFFLSVFRLLFLLLMVTLLMLIFAMHLQLC